MNMDTNNKRERGNTAEEYVTNYLIEKGYKIIKRNFHFGKLGEIDIICEHKNVLIFIEVRSRFSKNSIDPLETFSTKKRRSIFKTIEGYLYVNKIENKDCRFDFIKIDMFDDSPQITHLENAL